MNTSIKPFSIYAYKIEGRVKKEKHKEEADSRSDALGRVAILEGLGYKEIIIYEKRGRKRR